MTTEIPDNDQRPIADEPPTVDIAGVIGNVIPLPRNDEEQQPPTRAGTALVRDAAIEGQLLSPAENAALDRRLARPGGLARAAEQAARVVRIVRDPDTKPGRLSRAVVRHTVTVYLGVESWAKRAYDAGTLGVYRRQIKSAEAAGNQELLQQWTERKEAAVERRHKRLTELPQLALGLLKVLFVGVIGLLTVVLVIAVLAELSGQGSFRGVVRGVLDTVGWLLAAAAFAWTPLLIATPVLLLIGAWREGTRRQHAPGWLQRWTGNLPIGGIIVTADGIVQALQHMAIPALTKAFKDGWQPVFDTPPTKDGDGYRAVFDLPLGVTPGMLADKRPVLARNLHRAELEVWPSDASRIRGGRAGFVVLWVADPGVMDQPTPEYPLLHDGTADVFAGVPIGISQRGDVIVIVLPGSNLVFGGQPGQGKSNAVRVVFIGAALDPLCELRVHVFANNGDFDAFEPRLARYHKGATPEHAQLATEHLRELFAEVGRREERLAELGAKKLTRAIAQQHPDMRPIVVAFSECHELFGDDERGQTAAELAIRTVKRGRKTGVTLVFDTQSARTDAIPAQLVENVGINGCFAVKTWRSNDGFLGDGSFAAGIRATELRFNVDLGTMVVTGATAELFEIVRTYFLAVDDDTGWDAAADIIARAMTHLAPGTPAAGNRPAPQIQPASRDLLADLAEVLGDTPVPIADVPALLRELTPGWQPYRTLNGTALRKQLEREYGIKVPSTGNRWPLDPVTIRNTLAGREAADPDPAD